MLDKDEIRQLKADAHALKPVVIIGSNELTPAVYQEIDLALNSHELIKIRINAADKEHRLALIQAIATETLSECVGCIGHVGIFYRKSLKKEAEKAKAAAAKAKPKAKKKLKPKAKPRSYR